MVEQVMSLPEGTKIQLLAPVVKGRKGRHEKVLEQARKSGMFAPLLTESFTSYLRK